MSTTIDAAESVVRDLQGKHAAAIARQAELAAERQAIAFAAHTGDANARATLTELNAEDAVLTGEVASLLAAIDEAKARAAPAHRQAEIAARHARAREALKRAETFRRHGAALDKAAHAFLDKINDLRDEARTLRGLGLDRLDAQMLDANCRRALHSLLLHTGLQTTFLAPGERVEFAALVASWSNGSTPGRRSSSASRSSRRHDTARR